METNHIKQTNPKDRDYFYKGEDIPFEEDEMIEYKNYRLPLEINYKDSNTKITEELVNNLKKQFCAFLNKKGGRIYLGITDSRIVQGSKLSAKDRDKTRNDLTNLTSDFYPKCRTDKIRIIFVPVKERTEIYIPDLFVVKIIIKPGELDRLYSTTSKGFKSFMRLQGQSVELSSEEIELNIIKRRQVREVREDLGDFNDPDIHIPQFKDDKEEIAEFLSKVTKAREDRDSYSEKVKRMQNRDITLQTHKLTYEPVKVSISNLAFNTTKEQILELLNNYLIDPSRPIVMNKVSAFDVFYLTVYFFTADDAHRALHDLDGAEFNGKSIHVKLI